MKLLKILLCASLILSTPAFGKGPNPSQILVICSCGDVVAYGAFSEKNAFLTPRNAIDAPLLKTLTKVCHMKSPFTVWKTEDLTGKACPITL